MAGFAEPMIQAPWRRFEVTKRIAIIVAAAAMMIAIVAPGALAWSVSECSFTGSNSFYGNTAQAQTSATNSGCDTVWGKVHYKVDTSWLWSSACTSPSGLDFCTKIQSGADDADLGKHRALSNSSGLSIWYTSY
jgi:hypothetical protein